MAEERRNMPTRPSVLGGKLRPARTEPGAGRPGDGPSSSGPSGSGPSASSPSGTAPPSAGQPSDGRTTRESVAGPDPVPDASSWNAFAPAPSLGDGAEPAQLPTAPRGPAPLPRR